MELITLALVQIWGMEGDIFIACVIYFPHHSAFLNIDLNSWFE